MSILIQDLRHAVRALRTRPGYLALALLTLALGIGFTTATFSVVNAVLLRPLPYSDPDRLLQLRERKMPQFPEFSVSPGHYLAWKEQATAFEGIAAWRSAAVSLVVSNAAPERVRADRVTPDLFPLLGVTPMLGRGISDADDQFGAPRVLVLSHAAWRNRFGGRADIVGQRVRVDGEPATIVGVMPPGFVFGTDVEMWNAMAFTPQERASLGSHFISAVGRTKPGVTVERARDDLNVVARRLAEISPGTSAGWEVLVMPLHEFSVRNVKRSLLVLLGAVALVLLIACMNVANLLLARGAARRRELAVRAAIGASRGRLVRQLLAEQILVGLVSSAAGLLIAAWLLRAVLAMLPGALPRQEEIGLNAPVLGFATLLALLTPVLFGLFPALQASQTNLRDVMASGGRGNVEARGRLRQVLVTAEIALAMTLLVGAGLLARSFQQLTEVPAGFEAARGVVAGVNVPAARYPNPDARERFYSQLLQRISTLPRVEAAGVSQSVPMLNDFIASVEVEGKTPDRKELPTANFYAVSDGYLDAMGIKVIKGRGITARDGRQSPRVILVNQAFSSRFFGREDPLGARVRVAQGPGNDWREIVGVVADVKQYGLADRTTLQVYEPYAHHLYLSAYHLVVRTREGDPASVIPDVRAIVTGLDPDLPLSRVMRLEQAVSASIGQQRFSAALITVFGSVALVLALVGLYGVMAYTVRLRRQEFAIRVAHGARPSDILRIVVRGAATMSMTGIVIGLFLAWVLRSALETILFNVSPGDVRTYLVMTMLLGMTAMAASVLPALRASRVDPVEALRGE